MGQRKRRAQKGRGWIPTLQAAKRALQRAKPYLGALTGAAAGTFLTRTKKGLHQAAVSAGTGGSMSKFFYGKRKPKWLKTKLQAKNYWATNGSLRVEANSGVQASALALSMFSGNDCAYIEAGLINPTAPAAKAAYLSCSAEIMIVNQEATNIRMTLYDIIARRDQAVPAVQDPVYVWNHSYDRENGSNTDVNIIGTTPFSSDRFTQNYKVLKMTNLIMSQGQMHTHRVHFAPNRQLDTEYLTNTPYGLKGITCYTMALISGTPTNESNIAHVSTSPAHIDIVWRKQYKYSWTSDSTTNFYGNNQLLTLANQQVILIGAGTISADAAA